MPVGHTILIDRVVGQVKKTGTYLGQYCSSTIGPKDHSHKSFESCNFDFQNSLSLSFSTYALRWSRWFDARWPFDQVIIPKNWFSDHSSFPPTRSMHLLCSMRSWNVTRNSMTWKYLDIIRLVHHDVPEFVWQKVVIPGSRSTGQCSTLSWKCQEHAMENTVA